VAIPHDYLVRAAREEAVYHGVHLASQQLPQFGVLGFGLFLAADPGYAFGIRNDKDGLLWLTRTRRRHRNYR
jgi:hypothetical protein